MQATWNHNLVTGCCTRPKNCCYGYFCPCCALASAKSRFDGSNFCFNCLCFPNICVVRNYIRSGYGIQGRVGVSDCCFATFLAPCAITQLLNETEERGPKLTSPASEASSPWLAPSREHSMLGDPCDFCCTFAFLPCEIVDLYTQISGTPYWFGMMSKISLCQVHHLYRKSYGIGGDDCWDDCWKPTLCLCIPIVNCIYVYKMLSRLRAEVRLRGRPPNFLMQFEDAGPVPAQAVAR